MKILKILNNPLISLIFFTSVSILLYLLYQKISISNNNLYTLPNLQSQLHSELYSHSDNIVNNIDKIIII